MVLRKPSLRDIRQAERDAREVARAVLAGSKGDLRRVSRTLREQTEALVREAMQAERERRRDFDALRRILQSEGRKPKPQGRGLAKQLSQYRPQIEAKRAAVAQQKKRKSELAAIVARPSADGESIPFIAKGGKLIYIENRDPAVRGELMQIWIMGKTRPANLHRWEGKSFRDDRTGKRYKVETDMNVLQAFHDALPSDYHKRVYRRARRAAA
jgi:hypothetical protein